MTVLILLLNAKDGDDEAKLQLIEKYKPLIYKLSISIKLKDYDVDDLVQLGSLSVLQAINKIDLDKNTENIDAYIINSIKNNYNNLIRNNIKNNREISLTITLDGFNSQIIDLVEDPENIDELVLNDFLHLALSKAIKSLNKEELELLNHSFINQNSSLTQYCRLKKINYYKGRKLRKALLQKLRDLMFN